MTEGNNLIPDQITIDAYKAIKQREEQQSKENSNTKFRVKFYVETPQDNKKHEYFKSFNIDADVTDFMHTAELRAPYDSDLMAYWEPIRQTCVIYGANRGEPQMLFIGRVREVKQEGYEIVVTLQNYGWKFKQDVSPGAAEKYVVGKNAYQIFKWMFEFLKIDAYYMSPSTISRLKSVKYDEEGKITIGGEELEEIPDVIERVKNLDPTKYNDKNVLAGKLREDKIRNIENINYTAPYLEGTGMAEAVAARQSGTNTAYSSTIGASSGNLATDIANAKALYESGIDNRTELQKIMDSIKGKSGTLNVTLEKSSNSILGTTYTPTNRTSIQNMISSTWNSLKQSYNNYKYNEAKKKALSWTPSVKPY